MTNKPPKKQATRKKATASPKKITTKSHKSSPVEADDYDDGVIEDAMNWDPDFDEFDVPVSIKKNKKGEDEFLEDGFSEFGMPDGRHKHDDEEEEDF